MDTNSLRGGWRERIPHLTPTKLPMAVLANALFALEQAPEWDGVLAYDAFSLTTMAMQPPPWCHGDNGAWTPRPWADVDDVRAAQWLHQQGIFVSVTVTASAVQAVAHGAQYHPIQDYLGGVEWDGKKRFDRWFATTHLGAEDTPYHNVVGRCLCLSAVARMLKPGCKADTMPILEGGQGTFKSTALEVLFSPWFSDDIAELGSKDAAMQTRSAWCIEVAELSSMHKGELEKVKAFVSRRVDRYRPSYGRNVIEQPRSCILSVARSSHRMASRSHEHANQFRI